ncbi:hypothetical protein [Enterovirga rhinocerotis]|uniref:Lipoprotein n=1 Tax=Enterovirga rhinocerotis TaxID=1339210 RepID=A0A4R7C8R9_9HYPH|nr:hypothetical protein [Enterovirga rhinocerotis]TDR93256.1 hypothetical protein EV668_0512 [Enterovirga rhinocerotis]
MKTFGLIAAMLAAASLAACTPSAANRRSDASATSGTGRSDDYGTQRRMDVYGAATAPVLPTMGAPGYGK